MLEGITVLFVTQRKLETTSRRKDYKNTLCESMDVFVRMMLYPVVESNELS